MTTEREHVGQAESIAAEAPLKITFLTVMPSPYVQDLFAALNEDPRVELTVWYMEQEAPDTHWGHQAMPPYAEVLPGRWLGVSGARVHYNPGIRKRVRQSDADLFVVVGYIGLTNQLAMRELIRSGRPWVFWGEIPGLHHRGRVGEWIRSLLQRSLRHCVGIAGVGEHAVQRYREITEGRAESIIFRSIPYHCELAQFQEAAFGRSSSKMVRFLYCGQLIERKGVDLLVDSAVELLLSNVKMTLTLVGEGPLREELLARVPERLSQAIHFSGFQEVSRLPEYFRDADVFVLPSRHDGWGVVVNQALGSGLPVITTTAVGAGVNLIENGDSGYLISPDSREALVGAMRIITTKDLRNFHSGVRSAAEKVGLGSGVEEWVEFLHVSFGNAR